MVMIADVSYAPAAPRDDTRYGGELIMGTHTKPTEMNPLFTTRSISMSLLDLLFDPLVRINAQGEVEPALAVRWEMSADGLTYTFYLRRGVKFHDGVECTAHDVKCTYDSLRDPNVDSPFRPYFELVKEFKAIDDYTFQVVLEKPSAVFLYRMRREIIPRHLAAQRGVNAAGFGSHPVGTGPFKFKEWTDDNRIILGYNADYYAGRPYLDRIVIKTYANSRDMWSALMRGEIDYAGFIEQDDYEVVRKDTTFKTYAFPCDSYYAVLYNMDDPILADESVRYAVSYGIDRKKIIAQAAGGYGVECAGPFYPGSMGFDPACIPFAYDPLKAQALLSDAGWKDTDNDGIREKDGEKLELRIYVDSRNEVYRTIAMLLRQQLQEIGIAVAVRLYNDEGGLELKSAEGAVIQAYLRFIPSEAADIDESTERKWNAINRNGNIGFYNDQEIVDLYALGRTTIDREERKHVYQKIHRVVYEHQRACFLYFPCVFYALSSRFANTNEFFNIYMPVHTIKDWYLVEKTTTVHNERR